MQHISDGARLLHVNKLCVNVTKIQRKRPRMCKYAVNTVSRLLAGKVWDVERSFRTACERLNGEEVGGWG